MWLLRGRAAKAKPAREVPVHPDEQVPQSATPPIQRGLGRSRNVDGRRHNMAHDDQFNDDVARAEGEVQSMRHGNKVGRALWVLNEKVDSDLEVDASTLELLKAIKEELDEIKAAPPPVDLTPVETQLADIAAKLQTILDFVTGIGVEPGQAESLQLTFGTPEPKPE